MTQFIAVVHKDSDSAFGVHFPDIPGCFSASDDIDDLIKNAMEALELYFEDEDMDIPKPSNIEQIQDMAKDDLALGAFLLAVPLIFNEGRLVKANISLDAGMLKAIDETAAERRLTRSAFLTDAARKEIERRA